MVNENTIKEQLSVVDLESFFGHLKNFILELEICTSNIVLILDSQFRGINLIPINDFLCHYVKICYSNCAINTYKIFHSKEKRSFTKLFNKLEAFDYTQELKQLLYSNSQKEDNYNLLKSKKEVLEEVTKLRLILAEKKNIIDKVKLRRLKRYAHMDPDATVMPETLGELQQIKDISITVYNNLYGKIFGTIFLFNSCLSTINQILYDRETVDKYWKNLEEQLHNKQFDK